MTHNLIPEVRTASSVSPQALREQLESIQRSPILERMKQMSIESSPDLSGYKLLTSSDAIAERFSQVYENERAKACLSLSKSWSKDKVIYTMMAIVRSAYEFCVETADRQLKLLQQSAEAVMINPFAPQTTKTSHTVDKAMNGFDESLVHYQRSSAVLPIQAIQKKFMIQFLPTIFKSEDDIDNDVRDYIQTVVALLWLMRVNSDPLSIYWQPQGDTISLEHFTLVPGSMGKTVDWTVWPALMKDNGGTGNQPIRKGVILPIR